MDSQLCDDLEDLYIAPAESKETSDPQAEQEKTIVSIEEEHRKALQQVNVAHNAALAQVRSTLEAAQLELLNALLGGTCIPHNYLQAEHVAEMQELMRRVRRLEPRDPSPTMTMPPLLLPNVRAPLNEESSNVSKFWMTCRANTLFTVMCDQFPLVDSRNRCQHFPWVFDALKHMIAPLRDPKDPFLACRFMLVLQTVAHVYEILHTWPEILEWESEALDELKLVFEEFSAILEQHPYFEWSYFIPAMFNHVKAMLAGEEPTRPWTSAAIDSCPGLDLENHKCEGLHEGNSKLPKGVFLMVEVFPFMGLIVDHGTPTERVYMLTKRDQSHWFQTDWHRHIFLAGFDVYPLPGLPRGGLKLSISDSNEFRQQAFNFRHSRLWATRRTNIFLGTNHERDGEYRRAIMPDGWPGRELVRSGKNAPDSP